MIFWGVVVENGQEKAPYTENVIANLYPSDPLMLLTSQRFPMSKSMCVTLSTLLSTLYSILKSVSLSRPRIKGSNFQSMHPRLQVPAIENPLRNL